MNNAERLVALLRERGMTVGVAESLTGGDVTSAIVSVPGVSEVLRGGIVAYAADLKQSLLGVDAELIAEQGTVHPEVARQLALGARAMMSARGISVDIGIGTTGVAGPDSAEGMPVGTVFVGISAHGVEAAHAFNFTGDRASIRAQATAAALELAIRAVEDSGFRE